MCLLFTEGKVGSGVIDKGRFSGGFIYLVWLLGIEN